jgi:hypothetical protein
MFKKFNSPGSVAWRIKNYGLLASIFYIFQRHQTEVSISNSLKSITFDQLLSILGIDDRKKVSNDLSEIISKKLKSFHKIENKFNIKDVISNSAFSNTRLKVLGACIAGKLPDTVIETGTQHGVSASIISNVISFYGLDSNFHTFDLKSHFLLDESVKKYRFILTTPVRADFKKTTLKFSEGKILFFHDSDHSYENMEFEFNWAWHKLNVDVLIADDIDNNHAFVNFCNKSNVSGFRLKLDKGPAVGLALRNR